jgi:hypothetical protein
MKTLCLTLLLSNLCGFGFVHHATNNLAAKVDDLKPTVYLRVERREKETVWLRVHNNTSWALAVRTFSFYFNRKNVTYRLNGHSVFALPSDRDVDSLFYYVEKEPTASKEVKVPRLSHGDSASISWIPAGGSILFSVPTEQLDPDLMIYVPFQYEWELSEQLIFNNEPDNRVYFRGADLSNGAVTVRR